MRNEQNVERKNIDRWVKTCIVTDNELFGMASPLGVHPEEEEEEEEGRAANCSSFSIHKK